MSDSELAWTGFIFQILGSPLLKKRGKCLTPLMFVEAKFVTLNLTDFFHRQLECALRSLTLLALGGSSTKNNSCFTNQKQNHGWSVHLLYPVSSQRAEVFSLENSLEMPQLDFFLACLWAKEQFLPWDTTIECTRESDASVRISTRQYFLSSINLWECVLCYTWYINGFVLYIIYPNAKMHNSQVMV